MIKLQILEHGESVGRVDLDSGTIEYTGEYDQLQQRLESLPAETTQLSVSPSETEAGEDASDPGSTEFVSTVQSTASETETSGAYEDNDEVLEVVQWDIEELAELFAQFTYRFDGVEFVHVGSRFIPAAVSFHHSDYDSTTFTRGEEQQSESADTPDSDSHGPSGLNQWEDDVGVPDDARRG